MPVCPAVMLWVLTATGKAESTCRTVGFSQIAGQLGVLQGDFIFQGLRQWDL